MTRVLLDTNIILDIALGRTPFFESASKIFELIDRAEIQAHITASTVTDIYYISKKEKGHGLAIEFVSNLIQVVDVIGVDKEVILKALENDLNDFEDAIQAAAADFQGIDIVVTRNVKDFSQSKIKAIAPPDFLRKFK